MSQERRKITLDQAKKRFATSNKLVVPTDEFSELLNWAAVRVSFTLNEAQSRIRMSMSDEYSLMDQLLSQSELMFEKEHRPKWALKDGVRRRTLAWLLRKNQRPEINTTDGSVLSRTLADCLSGWKPRVEDLDGDQLSAMLRVAGWMYPFAQNVPAPGAVRRRLQRNALLVPLRKLVGTHFRGREKELRELHRYVGVLPPDSFVEASVRNLKASIRAVRRIFSIDDYPPLCVFGPGGIGKSALIGKFVLDHADAAEEHRIPFVCFDFDRPAIRCGEPLLLLLEALRQLALQYDADDGPIERARHDWKKEIEIRSQKTRRRFGYSKMDFTPFVDRFGKIAEQFLPPKRPLLFVFDTFEEIQFRGHEYIALLWELLAQLQKLIPGFRVVIAGRTRLEGFKTLELPLVDFYEEEAESFVKNLFDQANLDTPPSVARQIATRVGGNPLSLRLAADVVINEGPEALKNVQTRNLLWLRVSDSLVQGQLYKRILGHIHDPDVRRLAHPGLILRRITPSIIEHVLAKPCGVKVENHTHAKELFHALEREVALVVHDPALDSTQEPALRHRSDVRRVMLAELRRDEPRRIDKIQRAAIRYHAELKGPVARAEEIYHRLAMGQSAASIDQRWHPDVRPYLENAIEELDSPARAYLADRLDLELPQEILEHAERTVRDRNIARRARRLRDTAHVEEALAVVQKPRYRSKDSPLYDLEAELLLEIGRPEDARATVLRAFDSLTTDVSEERIANLERLHARALVLMGDADAAINALERAKTAAAGDPSLQLAVALDRARLAPDDGSAAKFVLDLLDKSGAKRALTTAYLARQVAARFAAQRPEFVPMAMRTAGVALDDKQTRARMVEALKALDQRLFKQSKVSLSEEIGISQGRDWDQWLSTESPRKVGRELAALLSPEAANTPEGRRITDVVVDLFRHQDDDWELQ